MNRNVLTFHMKNIGPLIRVWVSTVFRFIVIVKTHTHIFAGIPRLEQGTIVLETIMIPISPYTYNCAIHHIRTAPMSPKLYFFTIMPWAMGEGTCGKGWGRTTIFGFSVRRIDLLCYLPISRRAEYSKLIQNCTLNLADWFLPWRIYSPFEQKTGLEPATPTLARSCSANWAISAYVEREGFESPNPKGSGFTVRCV